MEKRIITSENLSKFVNNVIESGVETYGVQSKEPDGAFGKFNFETLRSADQLRLDYDVTLTPPKKFFTPSKENLLKFSKEPEVKVDTVFETNKRVLIGVHPYDMVAINQMDEVFEDVNKDQHYFKRRDNTIIIGVDPQNATSWSFWCMMDAQKADKGFDLWLTKLKDDKYFIEVASDAGKELIDKYAETEEANEDHINKRDNIRSNMHELCAKDRNVKARAGEIPLLVKDKWDHPVWKEKAAKCYSCGSCNLVCPTCYCFDVNDEVDNSLKNGYRIRKWDGCQLEDFAEVATGENFREERVDRFKHRLYRKTLYLYQKYDHLACVGCGRCSSVCLPNIADPVDIINRLKEDK